MSYQDVRHHYEDGPDYDLPIPYIAIICGGRDFKPNLDHRAWLLVQLISYAINTIYQGGAKGADAFGKETAIWCGLDHVEFAADWSQGKVAGPIRNKQMLEAAVNVTSRAVVLALPGGKGTDNMIKIAQQKSIIVCSYSQDWLYQAYEAS